MTHRTAPRHTPRLTPLTEGEHAGLAAQLNAMVERGDLVILFVPHADSTEFCFQAVGDANGKTGIVGLAKVKG